MFLQQRTVLARFLMAGGLLVGVLAIGCSSDASGPPGAGGAGGGGASSGCVGTPVVTPKRVVRLSEHQLLNAYTSLFGEAARPRRSRATRTRRRCSSASSRPSAATSASAKACSESSIAWPNRRWTTCRGTRPRSPRAGRCRRTRRASRSTCSRSPRRRFAIRSAPRNRPRITGQFWTEMTDAGADLAEALAYGVYGVLSAPSFVYRTELGADVAADGPLTPHELASAISFFLTDRPPDAELLAAAAADALGTPDQIRAEATRLLETPEARANLESALIKYFSLAKAQTVILNPEATPGLTVTGGLQSSIFHEGELFMKNVLWSGPLSALLTSRQTWTSAVDRHPDLRRRGAERSGRRRLRSRRASGRSRGSAHALDVPARRGAVDRRLAGRPRARRERLDRVRGEPALSREADRRGDRRDRGPRRQERARKGASTERRRPSAPAVTGSSTRSGWCSSPTTPSGASARPISQGRPIDASWTTTVLPAVGRGRDGDERRRGRRARSLRAARSIAAWP